MKVNYIVNKIKNNVSPNCSYCNNSLEKIQHLFWACESVKLFWNNLQDFLIENLIVIPFDKNKVLFGIHKEPPNSINNYIILCAKQYIWTNKFKEPHTPLSLAAFRQILKSKATECKNVAEMTKKYELADKFKHLILIL